jgi:hypothetical protein
MFEIVAGPHYNAVGRGSTYGSTPLGPVTASYGTLSTAFPLSSLYDGLASEYARWTDYRNVYSFDVAVNLLRNGDGEEATAVGWTGVSATVVTSATHVYKGAKSLKVTNTVSGVTGYAYQRVTVQAGAALALTYGIGWPTGAAPAYARIAIFDPRRAMYLSALGVWSNSETYIASSGSADFSMAGTFEFSAPSVTDWGDVIGELEVRLFAKPVSGTADYYYEALLSPRLDFIGLFGHNFPSNAQITLTSYSDWWALGTGTVRATLASVLSPVAWYCCPSPLAYPFYRVQVVYPNGSTPRSLPYIGEFVLAKRTAFEDNPDYPLALEQRWLQSRTPTPGGVLWSTPLGGHGPRTASMPFDLSSAGRQQMRDYVQRMTRGGLDRCVLVPTEVDAEVCALGRIGESGTYGYVNFARTSFELTFSEDALPVVRNA